MNSTDSPGSARGRRQNALDGMILSASGWRAVFGGTDDSRSTSVDPAHRDLVAVAATVYADSIPRGRRGKPATVAVGTDSRPTGPGIADTAMRVFLERGLAVRWLGVCATPEILAYTASDEGVDGFFYVSASHNPPGHNGLKMGYGDGAVMPGAQAAPLIARFRALAVDDPFIDDLVARVAAVNPAQLKLLEEARPRTKRRALDAYETFALRCAAGEMAPDRFLSEVRRRLASRPLGVIGELNGSARATSIDRAFLPGVGLSCVFENDIPGVFAHQILPEGAGLAAAADLLEGYARRDPAFGLAYVPDNDGDRGNLVFIDSDGGAAPLDAQTVFALVVMSELAWVRYLRRDGDGPEEQLAVIANGPTSARIDEICDRFGATLHRVEVGEANVVSRYRELSASGVRVVVMGEGSNGGNITPPSAVRDPLSTLMGMVKLHAFGLAAAWNEVAGIARADGDSGADADSRDKKHGGAGGFLEIAGSLPAFLTLPTDDPRAKMQIGETSHKVLKRRYESLLPDRIPEILSRLESVWGPGITWEVWNYEGTHARPGIGNRSGDESGGLRILFSGHDAAGTARPLAAVWMRGSGTEPVFRILADCRGADVSLLDALVDWQRGMVAAACSPD
jgi:phosphoglucomutase